MAAPKGQTGGEIPTAIETSLGARIRGAGSCHWVPWPAGRAITTTFYFFCFAKFCILRQWQDLIEGLAKAEYLYDLNSGPKYLYICIG